MAATLGRTSPVKDAHAHQLPWLAVQAVVILSAWAPWCCDAATTVMVCASISPTIPHRTTFWIGAGTAQMIDMTNDGLRMVGGMYLFDSSGSGKLHPFDPTNECNLGDSINPEGLGTEDISRIAKASCGTMMSGEKPLVDDNSEFQCFKRDSSTSTAALAWAVAESDVASDRPFFKPPNDYEDAQGATQTFPGSIFYLSFMYGVPVDYRASHPFLVQYNQPKAPAVPCPWGDDKPEGLDSMSSISWKDWDKPPCAIGYRNSSDPKCGTGGMGTVCQWWPHETDETYHFELPSAGPGASCTSPPEPANVMEFVADFCTNVPDGFICPVSCSSGYKKVGTLSCIDGQWDSAFGCKATWCELPTGSNDATGIADASYGSPSGIVPNAELPACGFRSNDGAVCRFTCSGVDSRGSGRLRCDSGTWWKEDDGATCTGPASSAPILGKPTISHVKRAESGTSTNKVVLFWEQPEMDALQDTVPTGYSIEVIPGDAGLVCPDWDSLLPPASGLLCSTAVNDLYSYKLRVSARGASGTSSWSDPLGLSCDVSNLEILTKFDKAACENVQPDVLCEITCSEGYTLLSAAGSASCSSVDGTWTSTMPTCEPSIACPFPSGIDRAGSPPCEEGGADICDGCSCSAACQSGWVPNIPELSCVYGTLTPSTFSCSESPCTSPVVENGAATTCAGGNVAHDAECVARCETGYSPTVEELLCSYGVLSPETFECLPNNCTAPVVVDAEINSCREGGDVAHGGTCTANCKVGWSPTVASLTCHLGVLNGTFECIEDPCLAPTEVDNVDETSSCAEGHSVAHGEVCTAQCAFTYEPSIATLTCAYGVLTPSSFSCEEILCTAPVVGNASVSSCEEGATLSHGERCTPQCADGYDPSEAELTCNLGALSPATFECVPRSCPAPTGITDSLSQACLEGNTIAHGDACTAQCKSLYEPSSEMLTCNLGVLSPATFTCNEIMCRPAGIANAADPACAEGAELSHGDTCTTQCMQGYTPSAASLTCTVGYLNPAGFECVENPCTAPIVTNGAAVTCEEGRSIAGSGVCTADCATGYVPTVPQLNCSKGSLTPASFNCRDGVCPVPVVGDSSATPCQGYTTEVPHGGTCIPQCLPGYEPSVASMDCYEGVFSPGVFTCIGQPCDLPDSTTIPNAMDPVCGDSDQLAHDATCQPQCAQGYESPTEFLSCELGELTPPSFECQPASCTIPAVANAADPVCSGSGTVPSGGTCSPQCAEGYYPSVDSLACSYGALTPASFQCLPMPCSLPAGIESASAEACGAGVTSVPSGGICVSTCAPGFMPSPSSLFCSVGALTPTEFTCTLLPEAPCSAPTVENAATTACTQGVEIDHGEACTLQCLPGYVPSESQLMCYGSYLFPSTFSCDPEPCDAPMDIMNAATPACEEGASGIPSGGNCTAACQPYFVPDVEVLSCNKGELTPPDFTCTEMEKSPCTVPQDVPFADDNPCGGITLQHGDTCTPLCQDGYVPSGFNLQCLYGVFPDFTCSDAAAHPCQAPQGVANSVNEFPCMEGEYVGHGRTCTANCLGGYTASVESMSCTYGMLSPTSFTCSPSSCAAPLNEDVPNSALGTCGGEPTIEHGSTCETKCKAGYGPSSAGLDCSFGTFDPPTFRCSPLACAAPDASPIPFASPSGTCGDGVSSVSHGSNCSASCANGYSPSVANLSCSFGVLDPPFFLCSPSACAVPDVSNAAAGGFCDGSSDEVPHEGSCTATCSDGYDPSVANLTCEYGVFTPDTFRCIPRPCDPPNGADINHSLAQACAEGAGEVAHGGVCTAQCVEGYVPSSAVLMCSAGTLAPATYACEPAPCTPPAGIDNAPESCGVDVSSVASGSNCTSTCAPRWAPDTATLSCSYGVLTPSSFECGPAPCAPPTVDNAAQSCGVGVTSVPHLGACTTTCDGGYTASVNELVCDSGVLSPSSFACLADACPVPEIANAADVCGGLDAIESGEYCTPVCDVGYRSSHSRLNCTAGSMGPGNFTCVPLQCDVPVGASCDEGDTILAGQTCTARCQDGYDPTATTYLCGGSGFDPSFVCSPSGCAMTDDVANMIAVPCLEGETVSHGFTCTGQCQGSLRAWPVTLDCAYGALDPPNFTCMEVFDGQLWADVDSLNGEICSLSATELEAKVRDAIAQAVKVETELVYSIEARRSGCPRRLTNSTEEASPTQDSSEGRRLSSVTVRVTYQVWAYPDDAPQVEQDLEALAAADTAAYNEYVNTLEQSQISVLAMAPSEDALVALTSPKAQMPDGGSSDGAAAGGIATIAAMTLVFGTWYSYRKKPEVLKEDDAQEKPNHKGKPPPIPTEPKPDLAFVEEKALPPGDKALPPGSPTSNSQIRQHQKVAVLSEKSVPGQHGSLRDGGVADEGVGEPPRTEETDSTRENEEEEDPEEDEKELNFFFFSTGCSRPTTAISEVRSEMDEDDNIHYFPADQATPNALELGRFSEGPVGSNDDPSRRLQDIERNMTGMASYPSNQLMSQPLSSLLGMDRVSNVPSNTAALPAGASSFAPLEGGPLSPPWSPTPVHFSAIPGGLGAGSASASQTGGNGTNGSQANPFASPNPFGNGQNPFMSPTDYGTSGVFGGSAGGAAGLTGPNPFALPGTIMEAPPTRTPLTPLGTPGHLPPGPDVSQLQLPGANLDVIGSGMAGQSAADSLNHFGFLDEK